MKIEKKHKVARTIYSIRLDKTTNINLQEVTFMKKKIEEIKDSNNTKMDKKEYIVRNIFANDSELDLNEIFKQSFLLDLKGGNW